MGRSQALYRSKPQRGEPFDPRPVQAAVLRAVQSNPGLHAADKLLMARLLPLVGDGGYVVVYRGWLARLLGRSPRAIGLALRRLARAGFISFAGKGCRGTRIALLWRAEYKQFQQDNHEIGKRASQFERIGKSTSQNSGSALPSIREAHFPQRKTYKGPTEDSAAARPSSLTRAGDSPMLLSWADGYVSANPAASHDCARCDRVGVIFTPEGAVWCDCHVAARLKREKGADYPSELLSLKNQLDALAAARVASPEPEVSE